MTAPKWEYRVVGPNSPGVPFTGSYQDALARLGRFDDYAAKWDNRHHLQRRPIPAWEAVATSGTGKRPA